VPNTRTRTSYTIRLDSIVLYQLSTETLPRFQWLLYLAPAFNITNTCTLPPPLVCVCVYVYACACARFFKWISYNSRKNNHCYLKQQQHSSPAFMIDKLAFSEMDTHPSLFDGFVPRGFTNSRDRPENKNMSLRPFSG
jgi:hypothetical protein